MRVPKFFMTRIGSALCCVEIGMGNLYGGPKQIHISLTLERWLGKQVEKRIMIGNRQLYYGTRSPMTSKYSLSILPNHPKKFSQGST